MRTASQHPTPPGKASTIIKQLLDLTELNNALSFFETEAEQITQEQIRICSIPAPPFGEKVRAAYLREKFQQLGLSNAEIDTEGNCAGYLAGANPQPLLVLSAHLDTVFPPETDVTVRSLGPKLLAPGIADDACGLAALLALAEAIVRFEIKTHGSLLFLATVGEEGEGDLRGIRYFLNQGHWARNVSAFVSLDGAGLERITNKALGSRRYRVTLSGPGGHSWGDFGVPNPVHALGRAIAKLTSFPVSEKPRSTFNVGRITGGSSVNAIPKQCSMDVDLRSSSEQELLRLDSFFRRCVREATDEENQARRRSSPPLSLSVLLIGERPAGETAADSVLVELALEATRASGVTPQLDQSSTDSNLPMSMGIPAITVGAGGNSSGSHTLEEWYDPSDRHLGLKRALLTILGVVGVERRTA